MHFSIILRNNQLEENLYGLQFIPSPVLVKGTKQLLNLNPDSPGYKLGSIKKLLDKENLKFNPKENNAADVLIRDVGHGTKQDLNQLTNDLKSNGFNVKVYNA